MPPLRLMTVTVGRAGLAVAFLAENTGMLPSRLALARWGGEYTPPRAALGCVAAAALAAGEPTTGATTDGGLAEETGGRAPGPELTELMDASAARNGAASLPGSWAMIAPSHTRAVRYRSQTRLPKHCSRSVASGCRTRRTGATHTIASGLQPQESDEAAPEQASTRQRFSSRGQRECDVP